MALTSSGNASLYPTRAIGPYARGNPISGGVGAKLQISIFTWARLRAAPAGVFSIFGIGDLATTTFLQIRADSLYIISARYANTNASKIAIASSATNVVTANEWFPVAATLDCTNDDISVQLFIKQSAASGNALSDTTSSVFSNASFFRRPATGATEVAPTTTDAAEAAIWSGLLSQAEFNMLASGVNPMTVARGRLLGYFPLIGDMRDLSPVATWLRPVGSWTPAYRDHAPVQLPPRRQFLKPSFPPLTATIAGDIPITAAITANLSPFVVDGGDTHDGLRRSRRLRRLEALRQRADAEKLADAQALRLALESALGLAAEVAPAVAPRVAEAVERAPKPADVDWRRVAEDAEQYARLSRAVAKLSALVQAEARRLADEDDDDAAFLLGIA